MDPTVDGPRIRARLGVVPQDDSLDSELTVLDNLTIYGRYFDLPHAEIRRRVEELLEFMQLSDRRDDLVDPLSGGMKRRLTIGRALINQPDLLLLDEPTTGLDPQARHLLWDRFYRLKRDGVTMVLTTHYMEEAEQLCDRLVIMDGGRIVTEGSPRELVTRHATRDVVELRFHTPEERDAALPRLSQFGERVEALTDRVLVYTAGRRQDRRPRRRGRPAPRIGVRAPRHPRGRVPHPHRPHPRGLTWRRPRCCAWSRRSGWRGAASGRRRCSRRRWRRCSSSPRWASGSATSSTRARAASTA